MFVSAIFLRIFSRHSKKSALEPIESSSSKKSSNPPIFNAMERDDITDLEHQLPIIDDEIEAITPMEDTPPPIPKDAFSDNKDYANIVLNLCNLYQRSAGCINRA